MKTSDFDYNLPPERIAQTPVEPHVIPSRLLVVHRATGKLEHRTFRDIGDYLDAGDLLVANNSRAIPAAVPDASHRAGRLRYSCCIHCLRAAGMSRRRQGLATRHPDPDRHSRQRPDTCHRNDRGRVRKRKPRRSASTNPWTIGCTRGHVPLPPYIHETLADPERYQTIYSRVEDRWLPARPACISHRTC